VDRLFHVPNNRKFALLLTLAALAAPISACGEDDVRDQANELKGDIDDLSKQDLREALRDAEHTAKHGGADAKREARRLERKIERELNSRD
jgi:hypothetical protein